MSADHSEDWHAGHGLGYKAGQEDLIEHVEELARSWRSLGITTAEQDLALSWLLRDLDRRTRRD
jgi:hypothetical protein